MRALQGHWYSLKGSQNTFQVERGCRWLSIAGSSQNEGLSWYIWFSSIVRENVN